MLDILLAKLQAGCVSVTLVGYHVDNQQRWTCSTLDSGFDFQQFAANTPLEAVEKAHVGFAFKELQRNAASKSDPLLPSADDDQLYQGVPIYVLKALEQVRQSGKTNMFDFDAVKFLILSHSHLHSREWLEQHQDRYIDALNAMADYMKEHRS